MSIGNNIGNGIQAMVTVAIIGVVATLVLGTYTIVSWFTDDVYETKEIIVPTMTVTTVDGVSDTTYTYTFK